jgi:eukaryotic-like serine/threonine-protein kinase
MSAGKSHTSSDNERDPIELLADSFIGRFRSGERPSIEDYALKHPELADEIRAILPALVELELNQSPGGSVTGSLQAAIMDPAAKAPRILGDYLILREIGRGGMGVVYEAVQQSLGRHVALKVLPQQSLAGSSHVDRFQLEARAAARLHHTNIVPVFGVGSQEGVHYYAMQFIQGQGLDEVFDELRRMRGGQSRDAAPVKSTRSATERSLAFEASRGLLTGRFGGDGGDADETEAKIRREAGDTLAATLTEEGGAGGPISRSASAAGSGISAHGELSGTGAETQYYRSVARVGLQVAEGLAYAHSEGILHRDIKPSNLLLDAKGTVWVTDFGLAKAEGTDALTQSGDIVGTLRYMAPERFDGWSDPRSDVYSMGVTLYEMLTLQYLFQEPNRVKLIDRVMHDTPVSPRKLDRTVPRDLETIILKAIAKEPAQRYASAEHMAEDLRRFLADRPVLARRSSPTEQAWRWCRRNPALATTSMLAIAGLVAAVVVLAFSNARIARTSRLLALALREKDGALKTARENEIQAKASTQEASSQRERAEAGEAQARAAVDEFLTRVTEDALLKAPGLQSLRRDLLSSALRFYEEFLKQHSDDPGLRVALGEVQLRVGKIQQDLGDGMGSRKSFLAARSIFAALSKETPDDRESQAGLAACQFRLAAIPEAIDLYEKLIALEPMNVRYRRNLAEAYNSQATGEPDDKKVAAVLESHRKALALREGLVRESPDDPEARNNLGGTLNNLGVVLERQGHKQDSLAMYLRAIEHGEAAFARAPQVVLYGQYLGTQYRNAARVLQELGRHDEAIRVFRRTIEHFSRLARENPDVPVFRARLHAQATELAQLLVAQGRKTEAVQWFGMAVRALEDQPRKTGLDLYNLACVHARVAAAMFEPQNVLTAEEVRERDRMIAAAIDSLRQSIEVGDKNATYMAADMAADKDLEILRGRPDFQALLARKKAAEDASSLLRREKSQTREEKLKAHQLSLAARAKMAEKDPRDRLHRADLAASQHAVGQVLTDLGRRDEAEKTLKEALAARQALAQEEPSNVRYRLDTGWTRLALAAIPWRALRLDQADREWKAAIGAFEAALREQPGDSPMWNELDDARMDVADKLLKLELWEDAAEPLDRVFRRHPASLAQRSGHPWMFHALLRLLAADPAGFRASCLKFFAEFRNVQDKSNLYRACIAGADALPALDLQFLAETAEQDLKRNPNKNWYLLFAAMARARAGDHRRGLELLDQTRAEYTPAVNPAAARAIILHHLGRGDEARKALADADRDVEQSYQNSLTAVLPVSDTHTGTLLLREVLRREAHTLIDGKPAVDGAYCLLARARMLAHRGRDSEFEKALAVAMASPPADPQVIVAASRVLAEQDRESPARNAGARAFALLDKAISSSPNDVALLRARAELLAWQGEWDRSTVDLLRMFEVSKQSQPPWFVAGTWVVGPYPFDAKNRDAEFARSLPPESNPEVSKPVSGADGKRTLMWERVIPAADGHLDLAPLVQARDAAFTYVMVRVYAPAKRDVAALVASDCWLRLWCNGDLLLSQPLPQDQASPVIVALRAGWNTLLAKVSKREASFSFKFQLSADFEEIARAFESWMDKYDGSNQADDRLERLYGLVPDLHGPWEHRSGTLATLVARRDTVFRRVIAARPKDSLLWLERSRYLAALGKWDEALAAYDAMTHDQ